MPDKKPLSATTHIEIRFSDCDLLGIVWHGNYVKYFEDGREAFSKKYGFDYMSFYKNGYSTPVVNISCDFKKPMTYKNVARVETIFRNTEAAKIIFDYTIYNDHTGEVVCTGSSTQVFVDKDSMKLSLLNPEFMEKWKKEKGL